jgi:hypothetical protein
MKSGISKITHVNENQFNIHLEIPIIRLYRDFEYVESDEGGITKSYSYTRQVTNNVFSQYLGTLMIVGLVLFIFCGMCYCSVWFIISIRKGDNVYANVLFKYFKREGKTYKPKSETELKEILRKQWERTKKLSSRPRMVEEHLKCFVEYEGYIPRNIYHNDSTINNNPIVQTNNDFSIIKKKRKSLGRNAINRKKKVVGEPKDSIQPRFSVPSSASAKKTT